MIIEVSFFLIGGVNFGLERSWTVVDGIMKKYPTASWKKIVNWKKGQGKYVVQIN